MDFETLGKGNQEDSLTVRLDKDNSGKAGISLANEWKVAWLTKKVCKAQV